MRPPWANPALPPAIPRRCLELAVAAMVSMTPFDVAAASLALPRFPIGLTAEGRLRACPASTDCVSSAAREAPNRAVAPLSYRPASRDDAFAKARAWLSGGEHGFEIAEADPSRYYLRAVVAGPLGVVEDVELLVLPESSGVASARAVARVKGPTPPWCIEKGCINGNQVQRARVRTISSGLGWSPVDATEMEDDARWTPIFFNTDAVPRDDDTGEIATRQGGKF